jgi:hypothetical protein
VDSVAIAPVQQKTRLPLHESYGASACYSVLSCVAVWVVRLARVCCNLAVTPGRLMASLIQSRAHFEPYV